MQPVHHESEEGDMTDDAGGVDGQEAPRGAGPAPGGVPPLGRVWADPAAELLCVLDGLGLDAGAAARYLGVTDRTVRFWCTGRYQVAPEHLAAVEALVARTAAEAATLVEDLASRVLADREVVVYASNEAWWIAHPEHQDLPARWWRHVVATATDRVPGVAVVGPRRGGPKP